MYAAVLSMRREVVMQRQVDSLRHRYFANTPVNFTDPTGLRTVKPIDYLPALSSSVTGFNQGGMSRTAMDLAYSDWSLTAPAPRSTSLLPALPTVAAAPVATMPAGPMNGGQTKAAAGTTRAKPTTLPPPAQMDNSSHIPGVVLVPNVIRYYFGGDSKSEIVKGNQQPLPAQVPAVNLGGGKFKATQKHHRVIPVGRLNAGDVVGTDAAGPCVGCIVRERNGPNSRIFTAHFDASENPIPTILKYFGHDYVEKNPGAQRPDIYIFGGDNSPTSNTTLRMTVDAFKKFNGLQYKYIDTDGLFIDQNGELYRFKGDGPNKDQGNKWK